MKQLSLLSLVFLFFQVLSLQGQDYQIGEWDIMTIGYANPSADYFDSGVLFGSEPRVNLSNNFALGLRGELMLLFLLNSSETLFYLTIRIGAFL